jgi:hypothetical protein
MFSGRAAGIVVLSEAEWERRAWGVATTMDLARWHTYQV